jgi:dephospho-CoA kinase
VHNLSKPIQIGVTGGIGAGKSLVCRIFQALGIPIYDADHRAKWLMNHHPTLIAEIKQHFGKEAYLPDESLNRQYLSEKVFSNETLLKQLNALVHPKVGEDYQQWVLQQMAPYVVKEAALLIEAGSYKTLDYLISVNAPESVRLRRVLLRDTHRSAQEVEVIMRKQLSDHERAAKADFVIVNDDKSLILPKTLQLHQRFLKEAAKV